MSEDRQANYGRDAAAAEVLRRRTVRNNLVPWCQLNGFEPARHHRFMLEKLTEVCFGDMDRLAIFMPPGSAKALALDTPIATPDGWRRMGDLVVGSRVFDENGKPCRVTWVSPVWKDRPCYVVRTDCGDEIVADRDHEWLVRLCGKREVYKIRQTHQLCRRRAKRPMIARARSLELPERELPIDPYVLGVWLGDGTSALPQLTIGENDAAFMVAQLSRLGVDIRKNGPKYRWHMHGLRAVFVSLGLLNDPPHRTYGRKYIPAVYLRASRAQRLALLQGLVDTDGTVCRERGCTTYCSTSRLLAEGVRELVRSLGRKAGWSESVARCNGKDCGPVYKVSFYHAEAAHNPRKRQLCRDQYRTPDSYIDVEPTTPRDTICIEVDSPSHLFLCGRSMTPTHNSTYSSVLFVPWYIAQHPDHSVISAAHTVELAEKWGRRVRTLIEEHEQLLGYGLLSSSQAAGRWETNSGAEYYAAGVGGSIAGWRGDLVLIDDPLRSREDAESPTIRDKIWDWYRGDVIPRLKPKGRIVLIQTRWNEDDLAGRIVAEQAAGGDQWEIISLPAVAEADDALGRAEGEALWPEWEPLEDLERKQRTIGARDWIALYQQRPAPEQGSYFKHEWIKEIGAPPNRELLKIYGGSDYAVSEQRGDYTAHVVLGIDPDGRMYLLDVWRERASSDRWVESFCDLVLKWKPVAWAEEQGQIRSGVGPFLDQRQRQRRAWCYRESFPTRGDKQIRCQSIRGRMALDGLYVPQYAPWYPAFRAELMSFPDGAHDDQADALGLCGQLLDIMVRGSTPKPKDKKPADSGYREWRKTAVAEDWRVF